MQWLTPLFLCSIMVPITEVTIEPDQIIVQGYDEQQVTQVCKFLKSTATIACRVSAPWPVNTEQNEEEYKSLVSEALSEIKAADYTKIIVSRAIDLDRRV